MKLLSLKGVARLAALFALLYSVTGLAQAQPTWVKEGVDWSKYDKLLVKPLSVDDLKVIKPAYAQDDPRDWSLRLEDLQGIQAIYRDVMNDVLEDDGGYPLVHSDGEGVLEVDVELLTITPWLKPGGDESLAGYEVETLGSGELTASVALRDSATRELLLLLEGQKAVGKKYEKFSRANNVSNIEAMFTSFANRLRAAMDRVHGK